MDYELEEARKKKPYSSINTNAGNPDINLKHFNKDGMPNPEAQKEIENMVKNANKAADDAAKEVGTFAAASPDGGSSADLGGGESSGGEGGGMGESLEVTEETHAKYAKPEGDKVKSYNNALKYAKKYNVPYCYGYSNRRLGGKFFAFEQPFKWDGDDRKFRAQYKDCGTIFVTYPDKHFVKEALELDEQQLFIAKVKEYVDLPNDIILLNPKIVSETISQVSPEEMFEVGYATPIYFYKKLFEKFVLVKCTQMTGFTGIDYRAAKTKDVGDNKIRIAQAEDQIANPDGKTDYGNIYNKENNKVKSRILGMRKDYDDVNKVVKQADQNIYEINPQTGRKVKDKDGNPIVKEVVQDLKTILFYPAPGSTPKVTYFIDLKTGRGFERIAKEDVMDVIYNKVIEITERDTNRTISSIEDMTEMEITFLDNIKNKVQHVIDSDKQTQADVTLSTGIKPSVRALYTNQIYYLKTNGRVLGNQLQESLNLTEAKRVVKKYYIRPQNLFAGNKKELLKILAELEDQNCSVYTLKNLTDNEDVEKLTNADIIYYYDDEVLYDKNHVKILDYDLNIKHEEERDKVNTDSISDNTFSNIYDDRMTWATDLDESKNLTEAANLNFTWEDLYDGALEVGFNSQEATIISEAMIDAFLDNSEIFGGGASTSKGLVQKFLDTPEGSKFKDLLNEDINELDLDFDDVNAYGEKLHEGKEVDGICCICGEPIEGYGNNAEPYKEGRCCDACNMHYVIPARWQQLEDNKE